MIYETADPFGGPFGLIGFDVFSGQSVALRFTPDDDYRLDRISLWFMSNDFSGQTHPPVTVSLRTDDDSVPGVSIPSDAVLEIWEFEVSAVGWDPMLETLDSKVHPVLIEGQHYWVVAQSNAPAGADGVWNWASTGSGFMSIADGGGELWQPGGQSAVAATIVEGTPLDEPSGDVNGDGVVNVEDLVLVVLNWGPCAGDPPCVGDVDRDGDVDVVDLTLVILDWD